jgi:Putative peptidoglycan binding domain
MSIFLQKGSQGSEVGVLQRALNKAHLKQPSGLPALQINNLFDDATAKRLREFQQRLGFLLSLESGSVGPATWLALLPYLETQGTKISAAPASIPGISLRGDDFWMDSRDVILPSTVAGTGRLQMSRVTGFYRRIMLKVEKQGEFYFVGVAIPIGLTDFSKAHIFFHPAPGQAGIQDAQYASFTGKWQRVFRYVDRLGVSASGTNTRMVMIVPFLKNSHFNSKDLGMLSHHTEEMLTAILTYCSGGATSISPSVLSTSSFSIGLDYMGYFLSQTGCRHLVHETFDFDGQFTKSSFKGQSLGFASRSFRYDQHAPSSDPRAFHVPASRWPVGNNDDIHNRMTQLFRHALTMSVF